MANLYLLSVVDFLTLHQSCWLNYPSCSMLGGGDLVVRSHSTAPVSSLVMAVEGSRLRGEKEKEGGKRILSFLLL